jgi:integrase
LAAQSVKHFRLVVKLVIKSHRYKDEQGKWRRPVIDWDEDYIDAPVVDKRKQRTPAFTGEHVTKIVAEAEGWFQTFCILDATTGLRSGEIIGFEVRHFDGSCIKVEQSVWSGDAQEPKTQNAYRTVDLHSGVANRLSDLIGDRRDGYIFCTRNGRPLSESNVLRRHLHPILKKLGIEKQGLRGFR